MNQNIEIQSNGSTSLVRVRITSRLGIVEGFRDGNIVFFDLYDQKSKKI